MQFSDYTKISADLFDVHERDIFGRYKFEFLIPARFAAIKGLWMQKFGVLQIGLWVGRDHSTVAHSVGRATNMMSNPDYPGFREKVEYLANQRVTEAPTHVSRAHWIRK